jgi:hypothetical protein
MEEDRLVPAEDKGAVGQTRFLTYGGGFQSEVEETARSLAVLAGGIRHHRKGWTDRH